MSLKVVGLAEALDDFFTVVSAVLDVPPEALTYKNEKVSSRCAGEEQHWVLAPGRALVPGRPRSQPVRCTSTRAARAFRRAVFRRTVFHASNAPLPSPTNPGGRGAAQGGRHGHIGAGTPGGGDCAGPQAVQQSCCAEPFATGQGNVSLDAALQPLQVFFSFFCLSVSPKQAGGPGRPGRHCSPASSP